MKYISGIGRACGSLDLRPSLFAVGCGLWAVGCGLWAVGLGNLLGWSCLFGFVGWGEAVLRDCRRS